MQHRRPISRLAAVVVPAALVLGSSGAAFAAKPGSTPMPVLTSKPSNPTNKTVASFAWTPAASTTYKCSLDGAAPVSCTSPKGYTGLTSVAHTFKLTATEAGKKASTATYGWTVDTTAPVAPVVTRTAPAGSPAAASTATFTLTDSATDVAGFTCALDGAAYSACTSPYTVSGLGTATHTVSVKAVDKAGNVSAAAASSWDVDVTPPAPPALVGPGRTRNTQPTVSITGSADTASLTCSLDSAPSSACTTSWTAGSPLADGDHTLAVVAADALGNAAAPATVDFTVDTTGPAAATLVLGPPSLTSATSATVQFADVEPTATFTCAFDGSSAAPCTSPFTTTGLADGSHTLDVGAFDALGNPAASALHVAWTVDTTAPATAVLLTTPPAYTNQTTAAFSWARSDGTSTGFRCSLDGAPYADCGPAGETTTSVTLSSLSQGTHTFAVETRDAAHNWSAPVTYQWVVDTTAPTAVPHSTGVPTGDLGWVNSTPTFTFGSSDPSVAGFVCQLDSAAWVACPSGYHPTVADGPHALLVNTVDQAGNPGAGAPLSYAWTLDTKAPVGTIAFPKTLAGAVSVRFAEPVLGVTATSSRLLLAGTTTAVATRLTCLEASGNTVPCALTQGVRTVVLSPVSRLVPGQRYRLAVTGAVHDLAGNPARVATTTYRALRALQESEAAVGQSWAPMRSAAAYGGSYLQSGLAGTQASYAYRGTTVTWYTATGPTMGTAKVYCGGSYKGTVNNYSATAKWHVARVIRCSTTTANDTLRVVATGLRGSTAGKGTQVVLDAVKVDTTLTATPSFWQRWGTAGSSLASGGRYAVADQASQAFALTFRGTSISWRTLLGKNMGKAKVYVDGVLKGTYDQFATTSKAATRTWKLTDKVHTIRVVVTGTRRTGATGTRVVLDLLTVG